MVRSSLPRFPPQVLEHQAYLESLAKTGDNKSRVHLDLLKRLNAYTDAPVMWRQLEAEKAGDDDLWVSAFLGVVHHGIAGPASLDLPRHQRLARIDKVRQLSKALSRELRTLGLDLTVVSTSGKTFHGFSFLEDFSDSNQARARHANAPMIRSTRLIEAISDRAASELEAKEIRGKAGKNVRAIYFARGLVASNIRRFDKALNEVVAIACNALFATHYSGSDIAELSDA